MAAKDDIIADDIIARTLDLNRFDAATRAKVLEILKRMEEDLIDLLVFNGDALTEASKTDKARLLSQAQRTIAAYYGESADVNSAAMTGAARVEATAMAASLSDAFAAAVGVSLPSETYFATLVKDTMVQKAPSAEWWSRQAGDVAFRFRNEVAYGISQGETNQQIIQRIRGKAAGYETVDGKRVYRYEGGVMTVAKNNAEALVITSIQTAANEARRQTYVENADILKGIKQLSTLDARTSILCVAYSGAAWKLDEKHTPIAPNKLPYNGGTPRHWRCRSIETALTKSFRELGIGIDEPEPSTRASIDGQVAQGTTMADFLERKGKAFSDEVLGEGRAELWRAGKITLPELLDQRGRPLSLEELRAKYEKRPG